MALSSLRLRRTLTTLSTLHRSLTAASSSVSAPPVLHLHNFIQSPVASPVQSLVQLLQSRTFRSCAISLLSTRSAYNSSNNQSGEIGPDTILFEGCDYNHWLIVMDFPKDQKIPPEEMVRTYEETCAKGLNIRLVYFRVALGLKG
ncbi:multiple organellar RNA editing factor 1, mitochondrial-like [Ziziphus jujuba]|uniref:Multiple organellar RNA editing factor 1, mitochondrial-like n=1 Tax=Ziziphus jujuba TaxID=326968 RepID=A0ABM4A5Y9_ZIZJJ|nr:multiple organellar RNA editing factor 1, mitochondrial-like [Ziziphus jujuba]